MLSVWRWGSSIRALLASVTSKIPARWYFRCSLWIWCSNSVGPTKSNNDRLKPGHSLQASYWRQHPSFWRSLSIWTWTFHQKIPQIVLSKKNKHTILFYCSNNRTDLKIEMFVLPPKLVVILLNHAEGCSEHTRWGESSCDYPHLTGISGLSTLCSVSVHHCRTSALMISRVFCPKHSFTPKAVLPKELQVFYFPAHPRSAGWGWDLDRDWLVHRLQQTPSFTGCSSTVWAMFILMAN